MFRKFVAIFLIIMFVLTFVSCTVIKETNGGKEQSTTSATKNISGSEISSTSSPSVKTGKLFETPTKITLMIGSHPSYPYQEDWLIWQLIEEATGAELEMQVVPNTDFDTKLNLVIASKDFPDAAWLPSVKSSKKYGPQGIFVSILDNIDLLPYFTKWKESTSDSCLSKLP